MVREDGEREGAVDIYVGKEKMPLGWSVTSMLCWVDGSTDEHILGYKES